MKPVRAWACKVGKSGYFLDTIRLRRKLSIKAFFEGIEQCYKTTKVECVKVEIREVPDGDID